LYRQALDLFAEIGAPGYVRLVEARIREPEENVRQDDYQ
jgi:hypothetical protein